MSTLPIRSLCPAALDPAMENDDFANVEWEHDHPSKNTNSNITSPKDEIEPSASAGKLNGKSRAEVGPLGHNADPLDLAGIGEGSLECTVTAPIKENDGSKDAYVSYLVTTNVGCGHLLTGRLR